MPNDIHTLFEQFLKERLYVKNVTPKTLEWYRDAFHSFSPSFADLDPNGVAKLHIVDAIARMRQAGKQPVSVDSHSRAMRAFFGWIVAEGYAPAMPTIPSIKIPRKVMPTFSTDQFRRLIDAKPSGTNKERVHMLAVVILDTGLRADEAIGLRRGGVDFDNLLIRVSGKGQKERVVPFTFELRQRLYRYVSRNQPVQGDLVFYAGKGTRLSQRNMLRDFKQLCDGLGIEGTRTSWHTLRHTMATNYIRSGGDVVRLQRILGHSSITTTMKYVHIQTEDLQAVHEQHSLLASARR
jgi:integrase/recombinase XerD